VFMLRSNIYISGLSLDLSLESGGPRFFVAVEGWESREQVRTASVYEWTVGINRKRKC